MSRSYRKPYLKDGNAKGRAIHHRRMRSITRQITNNWAKAWDPYSAIMEIDVDDPEYPDFRAVTNQWDICDWRWWRPNEESYYRK